MAKIREVIQRACDLRPNAFSQEQLTRWLALLEWQLAGPWSECIRAQRS